jgi:hypothetical protein
MRHVDIDTRTFCIMDDCSADFNQWNTDPNIR